MEKSIRLLFFIERLSAATILSGLRDLTPLCIRFSFQESGSQITVVVTLRVLRASANDP
jgi:hypothetical protein